VKVQRILCKRCAGRMLDTLVYRKDADVSGSCQATGVEQCIQAAQHTRRTIAVCPYPVYKIGTGKVQQILGDSRAPVLEVIAGLAAKRLFDRRKFCHNWHGVSASLATLCAHIRLAAGRQGQPKTIEKMNISVVGAGGGKPRPSMATGGLVIQRVVTARSGRPRCSWDAGKLFARLRRQSSACRLSSGRHVL